MDKILDKKQLKERKVDFEQFERIAQHDVKDMTAAGQDWAAVRKQEAMNVGA